VSTQEHAQRKKLDLQLRVVLWQSAEPKYIGDSENLQDMKAQSFVANDIPGFTILLNNWPLLNRTTTI